MAEYVKDNISVVDSDGRPCGFCDSFLSRGAPCVKVVFKINLLVTSTTVSDVAHPDCARKVARRLVEAAREADDRTCGSDSEEEERTCGGGGAE